MTDEAQPTPSFPDQMRAQHPADFVAALKAIGSDESYATDAERELAASYCLKQHAAEWFQLYHGALNRAEGVGLDVSSDPAWAARLAQVGARPDELRRFAAGLYPDESPEDAVRHYQRDIQRAAGQSVPEPTDKLFGSPF